MKLDSNQIKTKEVTGWRGLHLLNYQMSSCSQKVRILLGELGLDYVSHEVNLMREEQRSDWFLGINPNGLVPILVHDGEVHIESNDIIVYLDETFAKPGASFLPTTPSEREKMKTWLQLEDQLHGDLRTVTFTYLAPSKAARPDDLDYIGRFHAAFSQMDDALRSHGFLLGERMTLADISWFITLHRLFLAGYPLKNHPHVEAYYRRLAQRPAFARQLKSGPLMLRAAGAVYRNLKGLLSHSLSDDYKQWSNSISVQSPQ